MLRKFHKSRIFAGCEFIDCQFSQPAKFRSVAKLPSPYALFNLNDQYLISFWDHWMLIDRSIDIF